MMRSALSAHELSLALDPVLLAEAAGYTLDDWQQQVLQAKPRRLLLNCARQTGKSLIASFLGVHQALFEPGSLAVVASVSQRQALEMILTCRTIYGALGRPIPAVGENLLSLSLSNGSRILSIPSTEATVRGLAGVRLLVFDEASRIADSFCEACLPFVATSDGAIVLLSTPAGRRGFCFRAYQHRIQDGWFYKEIHAEECSRVPRSFLAEMKRTTSAAFYEQEFECCFNDATSSPFRQVDIDAAIQHYPRWGLDRFIAPSTETTDTRVAARDRQQILPNEEQEITGSWNLRRYLTGSTLSRP